MTLNELHTGCKGCILGLTGTGSLAMRLLDLGFTPGTWVCLHALSPAGETLLVGLRGAAVILRREEAACILVAQKSL